MPMHVETWGLALIVIVIVSWLPYRYLAPQSWKERPLCRRDPGLYNRILCRDVWVSLDYLLSGPFFWPGPETG